MPGFEQIYLLLFAVNYCLHDDIWYEPDCLTVFVSYSSKGWLDTIGLGRNAINHADRMLCILETVNVVNRWIALSLRWIRIGWRKENVATNRLEPLLEHDGCRAGLFEKVIVLIQ